jgi:hypothetical protein
MKDHVRAAVAYITGRVISGRNSSAVYDYGASSYRSISGRVDGRGANVYDYDNSAYVGGTFPSLYHYGESAYVTVTVKDSSFRGYDYGSSSYFSGRVRGTSVSVYDYDKARYYEYSL